MAAKICSVDLSNFSFDADCIDTYIAKLLGFAILAGAFALKVPQILNLVRTKDVQGLSPSAFYTEVPLSTISIVYNILQGNPFTSFGETCVISVQNFILVLLLWAYMKPAPSTFTVVGVLSLFIAVGALAWHLPSDLQYLLPLSILPMLIYSRLAQIITSYSNGTTGQLSIITAFLQFAGSLARIFTTIK
ncbi:hypothetical protein B484DRAFT_396631, partial [Ochromonadaceae sp. CCMP2298]